MSSPTHFLSLIVELAEVDGVIARASGDKRKLEADAVKKKKAYVEIAEAANLKQKTATDKKNLYAKEEKFLKEEREKIADRRKGLASHNNYKVQQSAEKELDFAARQINLKEESLLNTLSEVDTLEKAAKAAADALAQTRKDLEVFLTEAKETMPSIEDRLTRQTARRQELITQIDPKLLQQYDRVRSKHPYDAVVAVATTHSCTGCFMSVGPQIILKISEPNTLTHCPGCNRILYLCKELSESLHAAMQK